MKRSATKAKGRRTKQPVDAEAEVLNEDEARRNPLFVTSLQKGFEILKAFSRERHALSLTELTRATGLEKSAAQRFVFTLHKLGYLLRNPRTRLYTLSPRMLEFGFTFLASDSLVGTAQPFVLKAHEETGETTNLTVLDDCDVLIVFRIPSRQVIGVDVFTGARIPALFSASGRAICAFLEPDKQRQVFERTEYKRYTDHSVVDPHTVEQLVRMTRTNGYCVARSQYFWGEISVAAPILGRGDRAVAALSVAVPDTRMTIEEAEEKLVPAVVEAARLASTAVSRQ